MAVPIFRSRPAAALVLALGAAALVLAVHRTTIPDGMGDFVVFHEAAVHVRTGVPIYDAAPLVLPFKYSAAFALAISPLGALDFRWAASIWFVVVLASVAVFAWLAVTAIPAARRPRWQRALPLIALLPFACEELRLGQANALTGAMVMAGLAAWLRGSPLAAAAGFGLAALMKPHAAIVLPWLIATHRRIGVGASALAVVAALAASAVVPGGSIAEWFERTNADQREGPAWAPNASLLAWATRLAGSVRDGLPFAIVALACLAVVLLIFWRRRNRTQPVSDFADVAMLLTVIPLIAPEGWYLIALLSAPAVALIADRWSALSPPLRVVFIGSLVTSCVCGVLNFDASANYVLWDRVALVSTFPLLCTVALLYRLREARDL
jgi:alpha-1,2-mannosyltransferase